MRCNQPGTPYHASLDPARNAVRDALALVARFVAETPCDEDLSAKLAIIVEELVANIAEHGAVPDGDRIELTLTLNMHSVGIALTDTGTFHDPRTIDDESELPPDRGGGAGIRLVLAWSTILSCRRIDGRNELRLEIAGVP